jgi:hypothetical protein
MMGGEAMATGVINAMLEHACGHRLVLDKTEVDITTAQDSPIDTVCASNYVHEFNGSDSRNK